jgi:DnaJ domain
MPRLGKMLLTGNDFASILPPKTQRYEHAQDEYSKLRESQIEWEARSGHPTYESEDEVSDHGNDTDDYDEDWDKSDEFQTQFEMEDDISPMSSSSYSTSSTSSGKTDTSRDSAYSSYEFRSPPSGSRTPASDSHSPKSVGASSKGSSSLSCIQAVARVQQAKNQDPYVILGLDPRRALVYTVKEIMSAYKQVSLQVHPDRCPALGKDSTDAFQIVGHALEMINKERESISEERRINEEISARRTSGLFFRSL